MAAKYRVCPECHAPLSVHAIMCPRCGRPFKGAGRPAKGFGLFSLVKLGIKICLAIILMLVGLTVVMVRTAARQPRPPAAVRATTSAKPQRDTGPIVARYSPPAPRRPTAKPVATTTLAPAPPAPAELPIHVDSTVAVGKTGGGMEMAATPEGWDAMLDAQNAGDHDALVRLAKAGLVFGIPGGFKARVVENGVASLTIEVLEGPTAGRVGWIQRERLRVVDASYKSALDQP